MVGHVRVVGSQVNVDEKRSQESEAPQAPVDQHRVLAGPSQACQPAKSRSSKGAVSARARPWVSGHCSLQPGQQFLELVPENSVIVEPAGIPCNFSAIRAG